MIISVLYVGAALSVTDYAENNKVNGPTEVCEESELNPVLSCGDKVTLHCILNSTHIYKVH